MVPEDSAMTVVGSAGSMAKGAGLETRRRMGCVVGMRGVEEGVAAGVIDGVEGAFVPYQVLRTGV